MSQHPSDTSRPADGLAVASMICGILGLLGICGYGVGLLPAIPGLICGLMSKTKGPIRTTGLVTSCIAIGLCILAFVLFLVIGASIISFVLSGGARP